MGREKIDKHIKKKHMYFYSCGTLIDLSLLLISFVGFVYVFFFSLSQFHINVAGTE